LTQIFKEYAPPETPVIIESAVTDIDTIVRWVSFGGWASTQTADQLVRREVRTVLHKLAIAMILALVLINAHGGGSTHGGSY
jgi:hypothetical protein